MGLPHASQVAWILVVSTPCERPRHAVVFSPLVPRRRVDGHGRAWHPSWRMRGQPLRHDVRTPCATPRLPTIGAGGGEDCAKPRSVQEERAREYRRGTGRAPLRQTAGGLWPSHRPSPRVLAGNASSSPTDRPVIHSVSPSPSPSISLRR